MCLYNYFILFVYIKCFFYYYFFFFYDEGILLTIYRDNYKFPTLL